MATHNIQFHENKNFFPKYWSFLSFERIPWGLKYDFELSKINGVRVIEVLLYTQ